MLKITKSAQKQVDLKVRVEIPGGPSGWFLIVVKPMSQPELKELRKRGLDDDEFVREIVQEIKGLGDDEGKELVGEAAFNEVLTGTYSTYLLHAIVNTYNGHYAKAAGKN